MSFPSVPFGSRAAEEIMSSAGCIVLLAVYRKLNGISFDRDDIRLTLKMFGGYAVAGMAIDGLYHGLFHR